MPCCYVADLAKQRTAGVAPLGAGDAVCLDEWVGLSLSQGRVALVGRRARGRPRAGLGGQEAGLGRRRPRAGELGNAVPLLGDGKLW